MRIISLSPAVTEILYAIGAGADVVGVTYLCDFPLEAKEKPKVGTFTHINQQALKELRSDLLITSTVVQQRMRDELLEEGFPILHVDPRALADILESIRTIGKQVGRKREAVSVVSSLQKEIRNLQKNIPKKHPRVYIEEWYEPPMYSGNWVPDLVKLAGGDYFSTKSDISRETNIKEVVEFDPEIMFASYCGFGTKSDITHILHRKEWEKVTALKNKKVFAVNETILNRPGPRILEAVKEIQGYLLSV